MQDPRFDDAVNYLMSYPLDASQGLPENLFFLVSALTPIPNVDLLVHNSEGHILLSWRDDEFYGQGWHIPGGCIRFGETMEQRITITALSELGCMVEYCPQPIVVRDVIREPCPELLNPNTRGHHVTILYNCWLPDYYIIDNGEKTETTAGFLRWFAKIPDNLLRVHDCYNDILRPQLLVKGET